MTDINLKSVKEELNKVLKTLSMVCSRANWADMCGDGEVWVGDEPLDELLDFLYRRLEAIQEELGKP